jgi:hypothetical protein
VEHRNRLHLLSAERRAIQAGGESRRPQRWRAAALAALLYCFAPAAEARVFMTQQQALASVFPKGAARQVHYLTPAQLSAAKKESGVEFGDRMIVRYSGVLANGSAGGFAYFDTHRVRTLPETIMVVVTPDGRIDRIEILSFDEPPEYLPKDRWMDQFDGRRLDEDLSLKRKIRPMSGASLSARAIMNASRKVLALHKVIGGK